MSDELVHRFNNYEPLKDRPETCEKNLVKSVEIFNKSKDEAAFYKQQCEMLVKALGEAHHDFDRITERPWVIEQAKMAAESARHYVKTALTTHRDALKGRNNEEV